MRTTFLAMTAAMLLQGCAGYRVHPISPDEAARVHRPGVNNNYRSNEGYIIYAPSPFLFVTVDSEKGYDVEVVYLPDPERPFRVRTYEFLAKATIELTYQDGWMLAGVKSATDTTGLMELAGKIIPSWAASQTEVKARSPGLWIFRVNGAPGQPILEPVASTDTLDALMNAHRRSIIAPQEDPQP